jgi:hypothetical protein
VRELKIDSFITSSPNKTNINSVVPKRDLIHNHKNNDSNAISHSAPSKKTTKIKKANEKKEKSIRQSTETLQFAFNTKEKLNKNVNPNLKTEKIENYSNSEFNSNNQNLISNCDFFGDKSLDDSLSE